MRISLLIFTLFLIASPAFSFGGSGDGCGAGDCRDCHSLDAKEAKTILGNGIDKVIKVDFAEMPGLFAVDVEKNGQKFPIFLDFSKQYVVSGNIIHLKDGRNITQERMAKQPKKDLFVDVSKIPLDDALLLGKKDAAIKVIVFTDPLCPYCGRLHEELVKVTEKNADIAYLIKMFPLPMHPKAYPIAKNVVCNKDMNLLELSFASIGNKDQVGAIAARAVSCETTAVDETIAVAGELGIRSTPTMIYPNGFVDPGYKKSEQLTEIARGAAKQTK